MPVVIEAGCRCCWLLRARWVVGLADLSTWLTWLDRQRSATSIDRGGAGTWVLAAPPGCVCRQCPVTTTQSVSVGNVQRRMQPWRTLATCTCGLGLLGCQSMDCSAPSRREARRVRSARRRRPAASRILLLGTKPKRFDWSIREVHIKFFNA